MEKTREERIYQKNIANLKKQINNERNKKVISKMKNTSSGPTIVDTTDFFKKEKKIEKTHNCLGEHETT